MRTSPHGWSPPASGSSKPSSSMRFCRPQVAEGPSSGQRAERRGRWRQLSPRGESVSARPHRERAVGPARPRSPPLTAALEVGGREVDPLEHAMHEGAHLGPAGHARQKRHGAAVPRAGASVGGSRRPQAGAGATGWCAARRWCRAPRAHCRRGLPWRSEAVMPVYDVRRHDRSSWRSKRGRSSYRRR